MSPRRWTRYDVFDCRPSIARSGTRSPVTPASRSTSRSCWSGVRTPKSVASASRTRVGSCDWVGGRTRRCVHRGSAPRGGQGRGATSDRGCRRPFGRRRGRTVAGCAGRSGRRAFGGLRRGGAPARPGRRRLRTRRRHLRPSSQHRRGCRGPVPWARPGCGHPTLFPVSISALTGVGLYGLKDAIGGGVGAAALGHRDPRRRCPPSPKVTSCLRGERVRACAALR